MKLKPIALAAALIAGPAAASDDVNALLAEVKRLADRVEALEGISVGASLTGVAQRANHDGAAGFASRQSRLNYRGDVSVTLPGGEMGDIEGKIFSHFRFGQGNGVGLRPTYTSTPNTTAFETNAGPDDSFAILAQAWYS